jgi:hypothetical protein
MNDRNRGRRKWLTCFIPHRLELMLSPAWQMAPKPLRRVLERLEIEYLRHGAQNNGQLFVAFSQFTNSGVSKRSIRPTLDLGTALGLLEVARSETVGDIRAPNAYRLTYVPAKSASAPTDEWKLVTKDRAHSLVAQFKRNDKASSQSAKSEAA